MLQIGTGARTAVASNRPCNDGSARAVPVAAPLFEGTRFAAPAAPPHVLLGAVDNPLAGGIRMNGIHDGFAQA